MEWHPCFWLWNKFFEFLENIGYGIVWRQKLQSPQMLLNTYSWQYDIIVNLPLLGSKLYGKPPIWAGGGLPKGSPYSNGESGDPVERT